MANAHHNPTRLIEQLTSRYLTFPEIDYSDFLKLPEFLRKELICKNRILQTDTYNRTMGFIKGEDWKREETYTLQFRRAPSGYLVIHGVHAKLNEILARPISQQEFDFAREFYRRARVPFFNEAMWVLVIEQHQGFMPFKVWAVAEGTAVLPGEPVLRVTGPGELAVHFEPDLHRIYYESLVATTAHVIARKIGADRFIEVGKRGTPNEMMHLQAAGAMYVGGGIRLTSNDAAAACFPTLGDVGTLGHRFVQFYDSEETAFRKAIEKTDVAALLIDLTDSIRGIDLALKLKQEYRASGKKIWIRLDSGDIAAQTIYTLKRYRELGFEDPTLDKVIVEDISTVEDMLQIDQLVESAGFNAKRFLIYGAGGLLVTKLKSRDVASSGYKLSQVESQHKIKFSNSPGKESLPGSPTIVRLPDGHRLIAQVDEFTQGQDLLELVYDHGKILVGENLERARQRVEPTYVWIEKYLGSKTPKSEQVLASTRRLAEHYEVPQTPIHYVARTKRPPDYPQRVEVADNKTDWAVAFPEYHPPTFTHSQVFAAVGNWADPPEVHKTQFADRLSFERSGEILFDLMGRPRNPIGRTGLADRGLLGRWGPNHSVDPVITRVNRQSELELLIVLRTARGWSLPGRMLRPDESELEGLQVSISQKGVETTVSFESATVVYRGYSDDWRNTDNAWVETTVYHKHLTQAEADELDIKGKEKVRWMKLDIKNFYEVLFGSHGNFVRAALEKGVSAELLNALPSTARNQIEEILFFLGSATQFSQTA